MRNPVIKRIILGILRWFAVTLIPLVTISMVWCATLGAFDFFACMHSGAIMFFTAMFSVAGILVAIGVDEELNPF
tara:strand:+ start:2677 stop:2901 length:225 start_codon:yes stop_codon:yes gene_type:complete